jgi:small subunit ribosomal protein S19
MSRSIKKGPFVDAKLIKRVEAMNETNDKKSIKNVV